MNDDRLALALRDALAAPEVRPDRRAGQRLRQAVRDRQEARRRRLSSVSAAFVVLAVLGGIVALIGPGGGRSDDSGGGGSGVVPASGADSDALAWPAGPALLGVPLELVPEVSGPRAAPLLRVEQVTDLRVADGTVRIGLTARDADTLDRATVGVAVPGRFLIARVDGSPRGEVRLGDRRGASLTVLTDDAPGLLAALSARPVVVPLAAYGGRLAGPLELRSVQRITDTPCAAGVPELDGRCLTLGRAYLSTTAVDDLRPSRSELGEPTVVVRLREQDHAALPSQVEGVPDFFVFTFGGQPVGPVLNALPGRTVTFVFADEQEAALFAARLRGE